MPSAAPSAALTCGGRGCAFSARTDDLGRVGARRAEDDDGVADAEAVDLVADRGHDAGAVAADAARLGRAARTRASPLRSFQSIGFTPAASTRTATSPGPGTGSGCR